MDKKRILAVIIVIMVAITVAIVHRPTTSQPTISDPGITTPQSSEGTSIYSLSRVTKKPFGIYITPTTSPVQPEKFTGYHTGIDFEITSVEADVAVPVPAFCDGVLVMKKYATGYGGVAVESCAIQGQAVTIIYGHLKLSSIVSIVGTTLKKGEEIGILGKGYSTETDDERKHLHFGIHLGTSINILGYVQTKAALSGWLDPMQILE